MRWLTLWGSLLVACFAAISAAAVYGSRQDAGVAAREATANLALMVATNIGRDIEHIDLSMRAIVDNLDRPDLATLNDELRHLVLFDRIAEAEGLGAIVIIDPQGIGVMDSTSLRSRALDFNDREYFRALKQPGSPPLFVGRPIISQLSLGRVIPVARRIDLPGGGFGGVVVGTLKLEHLESLFRKLDLGRNGSIELVRADGAILARYPASPGPEAPMLADRTLFQHYPGTHAGNFETAAGSDGADRVYAYNAIDNVPLVAAVGLAKDDVYAAWHLKALIFGVIVAASCIVTLVLVCLLRVELHRRLAAERSAQRNERRYRLLAENSVDTIVMSGPDGRIGYISPAIKDVLGWEPAEIEGRKIKDFVHPDHLAILGEPGDDEHRPQTMTFPARHRDGSWVWLEARVRRLPEDVEGANYISNVRDVSGRKKAEQALEAVNAQLVAMAATDSLTNLSNRRRFDETLDREWRRSLREQSELALLLIDADHFKALNDQYGHQQGDVYLKSIARIIQECIRRPGDMAARYGGEEFAVLLPRTGLDGALAMAEKIRLSIYEAGIPHRASREGVMTVSIGVHVQTPVEGHLASDLVNRADAALYAAKRAGRNRSAMFEGHLLAEDEEA